MGFRKIKELGMGFSTISLAWILVLFSGIPLIFAQPGFTCLTCNNTHGNYTGNSTYKANLKTLLTTITTNTQIDYGFYNFSVGHDSSQVYGIGFCRFDLSVSDCLTCLKNAAVELPARCPNQNEAIGYYFSSCMLRYSNRPIFRVLENYPSCPLTLSNYLFPAKVGRSYPIQGPDGKTFNRTFEVLMGKLRVKTAAGDSQQKYATGDANVTDALKIYALTQCTPDLSNTDCSSCLQQQISELPTYFDGQTGSGINGPSCNVEFRTSQFYSLAATSNSSAPLASSRKRSGKKKVIWIMIFLLVGLLILLAILGFWFRRRRKRETKKEAKKDNVINCVDSLKFDYDMIEAATNNFYDANRLGKGTSTTVYKGMLPNGQEIAVKRLFKSRKDSELEFNNEVLILANLQHRNLVRLLGFCIEDDVRLLVFEFMPNESLDWFLYDPITRAQLDWEMRHKIILGIARGLLYLHEDSQLRVIHRDLKASNILLGVEMNPKISNFSRASRVHAEEPRGGSSKIKGTYGYMPPEYVLHGHSSIKSDVFSFGVLLLEIVNGQTISDFSDGENEETLVSFAWRKWSQGEVEDVVDKAIMQNYTTDHHEILKCIKIALLCVQEDPTTRPNMSIVVFMLNSNINTIPNPSTP